MSVDSVITNEFNNGATVEYEEGKKAYFFKGIGCVATWGERVGNQIGRFLNEQNLAPESHSVEDLARLVNQYLIEDYRPHEDGLVDVGYHVAGFIPGRPRLYHIFYGFDRPRPPEQTEPDYKYYDHSPQSPLEVSLLYNGRNDLAHSAVQTILAEERQNHEARINVAAPSGTSIEESQRMLEEINQRSRVNLMNPTDMISFGKFVVCYAAQFTEEVGPPIHTFLISYDNQVTYVKTDGCAD